MTKEQKKECKNCNDCQKHQQKAFELEVDEELHQERLNNFWKKYRFVVYAIVVLILASTAGIQIYRSAQQKIRLTESDQFETAVVHIFKQNPTEAKPILTDLANNGRTGYKYLARLELAGLAARQNDIPTALAEFSTLMNSNAPYELKAVATLSYVGHQIDSGDPTALMKQLTPFLSDSQFVGIAAELATVLYLRDNNETQALEMLKKASTLPNLSETIKTRLNALTQMIESK